MAVSQSSFSYSAGGGQIGAWPDERSRRSTSGTKMEESFISTAARVAPLMFRNKKSCEQFLMQWVIC